MTAALVTTLFLGAVVGAIYALAAFGLVLTYRTSGVFNFAQGAVGMFFAFGFFQLVQGGPVRLGAAEYVQSWTLPTGLALLLVVGVIAPLVGWGLDIVLFRRLRDAGEVVKIVATIGLLVVFQGLAGVMWGASTSLSPTSIFSPRVLGSGGLRASVEQIASIALVLALAGALLAFLRFTPVGIRMRAVVDRPWLAELAGIDTAGVSAASWAAGTAFAALAGILIVPFFGSLDPTTLTFFVVAATAAAVVGRLESFPLTLAGGFAIGIAQLVVQRYTSSEVGRQLRPAIPFIVLFAVLFLPRWQRRPTDRFSVPPVPPVRRDLTAAERAIRTAAGVLLFVLAIAFASPEWQLHLSRVAPTALVFLSLVVLSGYGGQVSLCQAALAGAGAFTTAHLVSGAGLPFWLAVVLGGAAVVPLGVVLALRAANLAPLFLGFATLAFGAVMDEVAFTSPRFSGGLSGVPFARPGYLRSPRVYALVGLVVFAVFAAMVGNLRRSKTGLALAGMRETEVGLRSLGVDVARLKLTVFSMSAFLAGTAGGLLAASDELATPFSFFKLQSLVFLALATIGGIGSWSGALTGAVLFQLAPPFVHQPAISDNGLARWLFADQLEAFLPVFFGLGAIGLARNPHGLAEQIRGLFARRPASDAPATEPPRAERDGGEGLVTFPSATWAHRPDCVLTTGKASRAAPTRLAPCPICGETEEHDDQHAD